MTPEEQYRAINDATASAKAAIQNGMARSPRQAALPKKVAWAYYAPRMPEKLRLDEQAAALNLFMCTPDGDGRAIAEAVVRFWVSHSGLDFAVEAWARSLSPWIGINAPNDQIILTPADGSALGRAPSDKTTPNQRISRHGLLTFMQQLIDEADEETRAAASKTIDRLADEDDPDPTMLLGLAALSREETWLAKSLSRSEDVLSNEMFVLSWDVLSLLPKEALADAIGKLSDRGCMALPMRRFDEASAAAWLGRLVDIVAGSDDDTMERYQALDLLRELLAAHAQTRGPLWATALVDLLTRLSRLKIAKARDPRLVAMEQVQAMPEEAIDAVRACTANWAVQLLPQLERAAGAVELSEAASDDGNGAG